jgi:hypothetical protein
VRRLSEAQASRCENAAQVRCQCRCHGALHGAARGPVVALAPEDVHFAQPPKARRPKPVQLDLGLLERLEAIL